MLTTGQGRLHYAIKITYFSNGNWVWLSEIVFWKIALARVFQSVSVELQRVDELNAFDCVLHYIKTL